MSVFVGVLLLALGAILVALRDRLGAQARVEGHGVTPLAYGVVGMILVVAGAVFSLRGFA